MMSDLPNGWMKLPLGEVNEFSSNTINPAAHPDELFELYSVPSFPTGKPERLLGSEIGSTKQTVTTGDVLISKINPRINRVWTVGPKATEEQIASSEWIGFRSGAVQSAFANYYFRSQEFRELLCSEVAGVGGSLTRAQPKRVAAYPLPVAPLAEQARISKQLDNLLVHVTGCNNRLNAIPGILKRLRQAALRTVMGGGAFDSSSAIPASEWSSSTIGAVTEDLRYGTSKKCDYGVEGIGVLRIPNITAAGGVNAADLKRADFDEAEIKKLSLRAGDLLVIRSNGSLDLVGRCGLVGQKDEGLLFAGYLMRLRVDVAVVRPAFMLYWLPEWGSCRKTEIPCIKASCVRSTTYAGQIDHPLLQRLSRHNTLR
jgi:type I restriction enzyme, S subunit